MQAKGMNFLVSPCCKCLNFTALLQAQLRQRVHPPPAQGPSAAGYGGMPGGPHPRRPPRNLVQEHYGPPGYRQYGPQGGHGYTRQPQRPHGK